VRSLDLKPMSDHVAGLTRRSSTPRLDSRASAAGGVEEGNCASRSLDSHCNRFALGVGRYTSKPFVPAVFDDQCDGLDEA
jgi:hypothetical protein